MNALLKTAGVLTKALKKGGKEGLKYKLNTDKNPLIRGIAQRKAPSRIAQAKHQSDAVRAHGDKTKAARTGQWKPTMNEKSQNKQASLHPSRQARLKRRSSTLEQLEKSAFLGMDQDDVKDVGKQVAIGTLGTLGVMGATAGIAAGANAAKKGVNRWKTKKVWNEIKQENPDIANKRGEKLFSVLVDYAPDLATNKEVASSYLQRAQRMQMTPHEFVQDLTKIQSDIDRSSRNDGLQQSMQAGFQMAKQSELDDFEAELNALDPR